jgi:hypothetical protein
MWKLGEWMMLLLSSCEWESLSHGSRGTLETLSQRVHYKSGQENVTLVGDVRGRDDDKWRTRDMFALSSAARGDGWKRLETLGQDELNPHGSDGSDRHSKSTKSGDFG